MNTERNRTRFIVHVSRQHYSTVFVHDVLTTSLQKFPEAFKVLLHPVSNTLVGVVSCFFDPLSACRNDVVLPQLKVLLHNVLEAWWRAFERLIDGPVQRLLPETHAESVCVSRANDAAPDRCSSCRKVLPDTNPTVRMCISASSSQAAVVRPL